MLYQKPNSNRYMQKILSIYHFKTCDMNLGNDSADFDEQPFCSGHWEDTFRVFYKVVVFLYIVLTMTAVSGNSLILVALVKDSSLHPPSKLLLRSLTITDLCVGAFSQPLAITFLLSAANGNWNLCRVAEYSLAFSIAVFSGVSLAIVTAISVDRLLALVLRLGYRQVVTLKRVRTAVVMFWLKSSGVAILYVKSANLFFLVCSVMILLEVIISSYSYTRIFLKIRRQQMQVGDVLQNGNTAPNMARYKRTVSNALWVHLTLATCYVPFAAVTAVIAVRGSSTFLAMAEFLTISLVYLNSSLNPVLYCWKIKEVRQAVKETLRQFCVCFWRT